AAFAASMFSGQRQHETFCRLAEIFPVATMSASPRPRPFEQGRPLSLPETYRHEGTVRPVDGFLAETDTVALLVLEGGRIRLEHYALTGAPGTFWTSMSVAKSFTS